MKKLTEILDEIKINTPQSKGEMLDKVWEFNPYFLSSLIGENTVEDWIRAYGYNSSTSLSKFLEEEWNYDGETLKEAIQLIEEYYRIIKPGDIKLITGKTDISGYKHVEEICPEQDDCYVIATKF